MLYTGRNQVESVSQFTALWRKITTESARFFRYIKRKLIYKEYLAIA